MNIIYKKLFTRPYTDMNWLEDMLKLADINLTSFSVLRYKKEALDIGIEVSYQLIADHIYGIGFNN